MSSNNRNGSVGQRIDGLTLSLWHGIDKLYCMAFQIKYIFFMLEAILIRCKGNNTYKNAAFSFLWNQIGCKILCNLNVVFSDKCLYVNICTCVCVCVSLQAYRFLAINKKLGLSGRPDRPVGCIGTCKVYARTHLHTPTHRYIPVHAHIYVHSMYPCCTGHGWALTHRWYHTYWSA